MGASFTCNIMSADYLLLAAFVHKAQKPVACLPVIFMINRSASMI